VKASQEEAYQRCSRQSSSSSSSTTAANMERNLPIFGISRNP